VTTQLDKIKARIRQLHQMTAANGATEGEVMNALAIAERLMREHGIDEAAIDAAGQTQVILSLGQRRRAPIDILMGAIAYFAEVMVWRKKTSGLPDEAVYWGAEPDVLIAEYLHELCYHAVERSRLAFRGTAEYRRRRLPKTRRAAEKAFVLGMVDRLTRRLMTSKADDRARIAAKLARLDRLLAAQGMALINRKVRAPKTQARYREALSAGQRAGAALPLNPGVGERPDRRPREITHG
jgi:hypothetical protein